MKKEDCVSVRLIRSNALNGQNVTTAYLVDGEYYDFEFTNRENPYGAKFTVGLNAWMVISDSEELEAMGQLVSMYKKAYGMGGEIEVNALILRAGYRKESE